LFFTGLNMPVGRAGDDVTTPKAETPSIP